MPSIRQSPGSSHGHTHCDMSQVPLKQPGNSQGVASHAATQTLPPAVTRHSKPGSHGQRPHGLPSPSRPEHVGVSSSPVVLELPLVVVLSPPVVVVVGVTGPVDVDPSPLPEPPVVGVPDVLGAPVDDAEPEPDPEPEPVAESVPKSGSGKQATCARKTSARIEDGA